LLAKLLVSDTKRHKRNDISIRKETEDNNLKAETNLNFQSESKFYHPPFNLKMIGKS